MDIDKGLEIIKYEGGEVSQLTARLIAEFVNF